MNRFKTGFFVDDFKDKSCIICLSEYSMKDLIIKIPCTHEYHNECIIEWMKKNNTCPICRNFIEERNYENNEDNTETLNN